MICNSICFLLNMWSLLGFCVSSRVIWREKCGAWPLIPISLSVPPLVMTKPCAYGTCRPATACWLCANSEKVSHHHRSAYFLTGSSVIPALQQTHWPPQVAVAAASPLMAKPWRWAWMTAASLLWTQTPWKTWCPSTTARTSSQISDSLQVCAHHFLILSKLPPNPALTSKQVCKVRVPFKALSVSRMQEFSRYTYFLPAVTQRDFAAGLT